MYDRDPNFVAPSERAMRWIERNPGATAARLDAAFPVPEDRRIARRTLKALTRAGIVEWSGETFRALSWPEREARYAARLGVERGEPPP